VFWDLCIHIGECSDYKYHVRYKFHNHRCKSTMGNIGKATRLLEGSSQNTMAWAFFAPNNSSSLDVNSTSNQPEHLRCFFCGPIVPSVRSKMTNGIFALWKHLELLHQQLWSEWVDWENVGFNVEKRISKKRFDPTPLNISNVFASTTPYSKDNCYQKQFEKDLALFVAKELVPLSFVEVSFLKRLMRRQNPCLVFPSRQALVNYLAWGGKMNSRKFYIIYP